MKNKIISLILVIMLSVSILGCTPNGSLLPNDSSSNNENIYNDGEINELSLFKTDIKFSQEQMLDRIKAEYLLENGGYASSDKVSVILSLSNDSIIDAYNGGANKKYDKVSDFILSKEGESIQNSISKEQKSLTSYLLRTGLIDEVKYSYSTVLNGVAVTAEYGNLSKIESLNGVENVILSDTYNRPQTTSTDDVSQIRNVVSIDPNTGIYLNDYLGEDGNPKYTGDGTSVAVLDSGFDMSHSVFQHYDITNEVITKSMVNDLISQKDEDGKFVMNASNTTPNLKVSDVYRNVKIPYYYDYADKDPDVFPYDSEHGTHVAGIIGGQSSPEELANVANGGKAIKGIAVNTQMVLMKVFPDLQEGGKTEDIVAAVEDAVKLGVDAINMSLGSSCGFVRERDEEAITKAYDGVKEAGISLITAASNSYSASFSGAHGNTNFVQNPDSGTVGSPSTYEAALSVASISGTLSNFITADGNYPFFYTEANYLTGKSKVFVDEVYAKLSKDKSEKIEVEYVAVPGIGAAANYSRINVEGKIAVIRRGDNTFEQKAEIAKSKGAIGCIIYNNIDGTIIMSVGKEPTQSGSADDIFPIISVSKDIGEELASRNDGVLAIDASDAGMAGPFMSDFSSWGPTPSLELKPEISSHGGNILSAIPGGGYDEQSGTSMATPNLCGIVLLIRQYVKQELHISDPKDVTAMTNQLLMSTATIAMNEEGNPYSPRKQGSGLASLIKSVTTQAYITVDGKDRPKIELYDDPQRTGVYTMKFNIVNMGATTLSYDVDLDGMTESVSTSDDEHVAETPYMLSKNYTLEVEGGTLTGKKVSVGAGQTAKIKLVYTLSNADKAYIEKLFPYGMYVEGFVKLLSADENGIDLNAPFLAFYGDWTEAPMFDKTYYEVETEAHDASIDPEDKITADYYATIPYGSYYYNYIIPLGTYLYDMDTTKYAAIPATEDHAAMSNMLGTIDGLASIYAGLFRNAATMTYTLTDKITGEVVWELVEYNARKAYSNGAQAIPYNNFLNIRSTSTDFGGTGLINNHKYNLTLTARMDYERPDGEGNMVVADGIDTNVRNTFSFDFTMDTEAPVIKSATYEKKYDRALKKDRYYVNLTVYDNHYAMAVTPIIFTSQSSYTTLGDPIPLYGEENKDCTVRFEITDILEDIGTDAVLSSAIGFSIEDYALNTNLYMCQLPGTNPGSDPNNPAGGFAFTADGTKDGGKAVLEVTVGEVIDLVQYLYTEDKTVDEDKSYLKYLTWESSNEKIAVVKEGRLLALKKGKVTITVTEYYNGRTANVLVSVVNPETEALSTSSISVTPTVTLLSQGSVTDDYTNATVESMRFSYFDTLFAYSRAAQTSEIGQTDSRMYVSSLPGSGANGRVVSLYPGEKIKFEFDFDPWYAKDNYDFEYASSNGDNVKIEQDGTMTALKEGTSTITLTPIHKATGNKSNVRASISVTVKNEFVIENRMLIAYKGLGGEVVIPDDEGILYIGAYAFCLYDTDYTYELPEDDYDANKIPTGNTAVTSIVVPAGVEEIQKYAFYNCTSLRKVELPKSIKFVREFAFAKDVKLEEVTNLDAPFTFGAYCFYNCENLKSAKTSNAYALGRSAFEGCSSLTEVDVLPLRNAGNSIFSGCTSLKNVTFGEHTKLSPSMFENSGVESVTLYENLEIPERCFFSCKDLTTVSFENDLLSINESAFKWCSSLVTVTFNGSVNSIGREAFLGAKELQTLTLPNCEVDIAHQAFGACPKLSKVVFGANSKLGELEGSIFFAEENQDVDRNVAAVRLTLDERKTAIETFEVDANNPYYKDNGDFLVGKDDESVIYLAKTGKIYGQDGNYELPASYTEIKTAAFAGVNISVFTVNGGLIIGDYAFINTPYITKLVLPMNEEITVGDYAFNASVNLVDVVNLISVSSAGDYAFARTALNDENAVLETKEGSVYGEGAFYLAKLTKITLGANSKYGVGAFGVCEYLTDVEINGEGSVILDRNAFAYATKLKNFDFSGISDQIPEGAFRDCYELTVVNAPHVKVIGNGAFANCSSINSVTFTGAEEIGIYAFATVSEGNSASQTSQSPKFTAIALPNVQNIGGGAFYGCHSLEEVDLSAATNLELGISAFEWCVALKTVILPSSLNKIGQLTFAGCESLETINLENVEYIDQYAFLRCANLLGGGDETTEINLTALKELGEAAFAQSGLIGKISAPALTIVGPYAFLYSGAYEISAPSVVEIGAGAFAEMYNLKSFKFSKDLEFIDVVAFLNSNGVEKYLGPNGTENEVINDYAKLINGVLYTVENGNLILKSVPMAKTFEGDTLLVEEGTVKVDVYGGNKNFNVKKIILPSTLKAIGDFAFNGYNALETVQFKTVKAPILETMYNFVVKGPTVQSMYEVDCIFNIDENDPDYHLFYIDEKDPGYGLLHAYCDLVGWDLYYFNFISLAGKKEPIKMILPANKKLEGYDSIVYLAYFGSVENAEKDGVAMETNLISFIDYAKAIMAKDKISLTDGDLVNSAVIALNGLTQKGTDFGISENEWNAMVKAVNDAKVTYNVNFKINELRLERVDKSVIDLQYDIFALTADSDQELVNSITQRLNGLTEKEKNLLDLTNYNSLNQTQTPDSSSSADNSVSSSSGEGGSNLLALWIVLGVLGAAAIAVAIIFIIKRRKA